MMMSVCRLLQQWRLEDGPVYLRTAAEQRLAFAMFGHMRLGVDAPAYELDYAATTLVAELMPVRP